MRDRWWILHSSIFIVCAGGASKDSFSPKIVDVCLVFISVAMSSLSDQIFVVGGGLARSFGKPTLFFFKKSSIVVLLDKECFCGDNAQKEYLFGENSWPATLVFESNQISQA